MGTAHSTEAKTGTAQSTIAKTPNRKVYVRLNQMKKPGPIIQNIINNS